MCPFLVVALRKHAGGMFLAYDRSGYAARREVVWGKAVGSLLTDSGAGIFALGRNSGFAAHHKVCPFLASSTNWDGLVSAADVGNGLDRSVKTPHPSFASQTPPSPQGESLAATLILQQNRRPAKARRRFFKALFFPEAFSGGRRLPQQG